MAAATASLNIRYPIFSHKLCDVPRSSISGNRISTPKGYSVDCHAFASSRQRPSHLRPPRLRIVACTDVDKEPMLPPYNVLITGSTKGIGYALAKEFLRAGDSVLICSRSEERVKSAIQSLRQEYGEQLVWGTECDVRKGQDVKNLVAFAQEKMKHIDIWINNAGSNAYSYKSLAESSDEDLLEVVSTNTLGLMLCCREAIKMMSNQPRGGHIFNMDGAGSDGRPTPRFAAYGATKRSVVHLTKSLQAELQMQEVKNVLVHNLSPGMVTTDLLMSGATTKQVRRSYFCVHLLPEKYSFFLCCVFCRPSSSSTYLLSQLKWCLNTLFPTSDLFQSMDPRGLPISVSSRGLKPTPRYSRELHSGPEEIGTFLRRIKMFY